MLSRAVLPLTRPNVLASAARASRVSALATQRPRWYAKGKGTPYELPKSPKAKKSKTTPEASQNEHAKEQPELDTKAKPSADAAESNTV